MNYPVRSERGERGERGERYLVDLSEYEFRFHFECSMNDEIKQGLRYLIIKGRGKREDGIGERDRSESFI